MRNALLVAWRDFSESARTKGFWIGLLLFPAIIFAFVQAPKYLEKKGTPQRYFVLIDQSGQFEEIIEDGLERAHQRRVLKSLVDYGRENASLEKAGRANGGKKLDLEDIPAPDVSGGAEQFLEEFAEANPDALEKFLERGGRDMMLERMKPYLRADADAYEEPKRRYVRVAVPQGVDSDAGTSVISETLKPFLRGGRKIRVEGEDQKLYAAVLIPADIEGLVSRPGQPPVALMSGRHGVEYWSSNLADLDLHNDIRNVMNREIRRKAYLAAGMDIEAVRQVERTRVPIATLNPKKAKGKEKVSMADFLRQWAPSGFVYLLWISIFTISQMLLSNTIEEKSNRIIEVLLSSVTPGELMMGKLAGIAAIGLAMIGVWVGSLLAILAWQAGPEVAFAQHAFEVLKNSHLLPAFFVYFVLGYLLYSGVILTIGSLCNTLKDAQNYMGVVTVIMMVPMMTMFFIPKDPNGTLATALSWIPIYTPFAMMNRMAADPPLFEVVGTTVLLILTTVAVLWLSGKIFRIGILRTGQPPKVLELFRWILDAVRGRS